MVSGDLSDEVEVVSGESTGHEPENTFEGFLFLVLFDSFFFIHILRLITKIITSV